MKILIFHQNFPGQFKSLAPSLALRGHDVVCIGDEKNLKQRADGWPKFIKVLPYATPNGAHKHTHHYLQYSEACIRRGQAVFRHLIELKKDGFYPDVCIGHTGWGESLYIKQVYPNAKVIGFFEFFYRSIGQDVGFDPEFRPSDDEYLKIPTRNVINYLSLDGADYCLTPTHWQASTYPYEFRRRMSVIFDGIDTTKLIPNASVELELNGQSYKSGDIVLTFVNRNLEPYRGYHQFIRALPKIMSANKDVRVIIVGGDDVSYGKPAPDGQKWKDIFFEEVQNSLPLERINFVGRVKYDDFVKILQISTAHVYLTYPFVQSWSMVEAMSVGCNVIASATAPCVEFIRHGYNGILFNFFDDQTLVSHTLAALNEPNRFATLRERARDSIVRNYDLSTKCLPAQIDLIERSISSKFLYKSAQDKKFEIRVCAMAPDFMNVRIDQPYSMLSELPGVYVEIMYKKLDISPPRHNADHNILVIQRIIPQDSSAWKEMLCNARKNGWKVVSEWDDHPDRLPEPIRKKFTKESWSVFSEVDGIQTSTNFLKSQLSAYNSNIVVFQNCVRKVHSVLPKKTGPIKIFFGALNRENDYKNILRYINQALIGKDCEFHVVHDRNFYLNIELAKDKKFFYPSLAYNKYIEILSKCDIAIMPLENSFENKCKSDVKFIEATSVGVLSVASPTVYGDVILNGINGYIAKNDEDWYGILNELLKDRNYQEQVIKAREYVISNRLEVGCLMSRLNWYSSL